MGTEKREVGGERRNEEKRGEGKDGHSSWGPEELAEEWVPWAGEDKGGVKETPE